MTPLPLVPPDFFAFATADRPLRPSKLGKLLSCPMSYLLSADAGDGNSYAQTGSMLHAGVAAYHKAQEDREAAGLAAMAASRSTFSAADPADATRMYDKYIQDNENASAEVVWCEERVRLILPPDDSDPTGQAVHIAGTLDQVRRYPDGSMKVWDLKSSKLPAEEQLLDYVIQQSAYVLAARATLDPGINFGGLICSRNYFIARAKVHNAFSLSVGVDSATLLIDAIRVVVANIRRGKTVFNPSVAICKYCDLKPYPNCNTLLPTRTT